MQVTSVSAMAAPREGDRNSAYVEPSDVLMIHEKRQLYRVSRHLIRPCNPIIGVEALGIIRLISGIHRLLTINRHVYKAPGRGATSHGEWSRSHWILPPPPFSVIYNSSRPLRTTRYRHGCPRKAYNCAHPLSDAFAGDAEYGSSGREEVGSVVRVHIRACLTRHRSPTGTFNRLIDSRES